MCLKWPNDIYFGDKVKIGGVIVTSSAMSGTLSAVIGIRHYSFQYIFGEGLTCIIYLGILQFIINV